MEPLMFVMAVLGCGESDAPCREIAVAEARYESQAQCLAASEDALWRYENLPYPSVVAQCRPANARPQLLRGSDVTLPEPQPLRQQRFADTRPPRSSR
jgi:hypothetical protein